MKHLTIAALISSLCAACAEPDHVTNSEAALDDRCYALGDPALDERELARLEATYPQCVDAVERARDRDDAAGTFDRYRIVTDDGVSEYECGILTCTCYNTMDCLVMAWEKTDGPCVNNGGGGKTCCIDAC